MSLETPRLSICIVNWNCREELSSCLDSIAQSVRVAGHEVVVIDNNSQDGSVQALTVGYPWVTLHTNPSNQGFAKACNQALRMSRGRYVLLLNPDTVVGRGALERLVSFADATPQAAIVGCKVLNTDGTLQYSCRRFPTVIAGVIRNTPFGRLLPRSRFVSDYLMTEWDHGSVKAVDWVSGAALLIRREVIATVGLLDERFFMYCEDMDFCRRASCAGWKVMYYPEAEVVHAVGRSSSKASTRMVIEFHKSMYRFYRKYHSTLLGRICSLAVAVGLIARFLLVLGSAKATRVCSDLRTTVTSRRVRRQLAGRD